MRTTYIDLGLLDKITVTEKRQIAIIWHEKTPSTPKIFLGVKYGEIEGKPEGWGGNRLSTEELSRYQPNNEVDEENKVVYERPKVSLYLTNGQSYDQYFDTDEDAEEYAFHISEVSGKSLYAINHN